MTKKCKRCEETKDRSLFSAAPKSKDGLSYFCKACVVLRNTEYWRTPAGRVSQIFAVQTINSKQRGHLLPDYSRKELTEWALTQGLEKLVLQWQQSGYAKDLVPSVDRRNPTKGYSLDNIRLVTWAENNEKAYADRKACVHVTKQNRRVEQMTLNGTHIAFFDSIASAARNTGAVRSNINAMCTGNNPQIKSVAGFLWRHA